MTSRYIIALGLIWCAFVGRPRAVGAQDDTIPRGARSLLLLESRFGAEPGAAAVVVLARHAAYRLEASAPCAPAVHPVEHRAHAAFIVRIGDTLAVGPRHFALVARRAGPHRVTVSGLAPGSVITLRLYEDTVETRRIAVARSRELSIGITLAAGVHSGYRLDSTGGAAPRGGTDTEACALIETGDRFGTCLGFSTQSFPDHGFPVRWLFIEQRARLASRMLAGRRTDFGVALRYSQGLSAGPNHLDPALVGLGLYARHYLRPGESRHGWSLFGAWQHGRLPGVVENDHRDTERFIAGVTWVP